MMRRKAGRPERQPPLRAILLNQIQFKLKHSKEKCEGKIFLELLS